MKIFKQWLTIGCIIFTVLAVAIILLNMAMGVTTQSTVNLILFLPCAFALSAAEVLFRSERLPRWIRMLSHYLIYTLSCFLLLYLPRASKQPMINVAIFVFFSLIYWAVFGLIVLIRSRVRKLLEED